MSEKTMNEYWERRNRRDILYELKKEGKFADFLFLAWGIIEHSLDEAIMRELQLTSHNPRWRKILDDYSFNEKLRIQKEEYSFLTDTDVEAVKSFRTVRNDLFHGSGWFVPILSEPEKEKIMNTAVIAVDIMHNLSERVYNPEPLQVRKRNGKMPYKLDRPQNTNHVDKVNSEMKN